MAGVWRILSFATAFAVLFGGCPVEPSSGVGLVPGSGDHGVTTGQNGTSTSPSSGAAGSTGGVTAGTQSFNDALTEEFPDCTEPANGDEWRAEILRLVNVERERRQVAPLTHNQTLEELATRYACEMIHYDFFAHDNPVTGTEAGDRAAEFGYDYLALGENLAAGQSTPADVMEQWMDSELHRRTILSSDLTELGVGVRIGGHYGTYWVQEFGRPLGG